MTTNFTIIESEYDQEIPQSQTADKPMAPRRRSTYQSPDTRKTDCGQLGACYPLSSLFDAQAYHNNDLENNFLCHILSGDRGGLQQYICFCKLVSAARAARKKVLNPGLSVQRIAADLVIVYTDFKITV